MATGEFFETSSARYQKHLKIIDEPDQPTIAFPIVLTAPDGADLPTVLKATNALGPQPSQDLKQSALRQLLDANGGAINFKNMPLRSAQDFSDWLVALSGSGERALTPHQDIGMQVLRKPHAKHVVTTNEGPPTHVIMWHNEYSVSPSHPAYVAFFCLSPPATGGQTPLVSSVAVHNRLQKAAPEFLAQCRTKGLTYTIPHTSGQVRGIVGGNGVYTPSAFGPLDGVLAASEEERRSAVERRIKDLAELGGWREGGEGDEGKPNWQRKGFGWKWKDDGGVDITHRVPGVRMHPTRGTPTIFNAVATRYTNAKIHNTFAPPHTYTTDDGKEAVAIPPMFVGLEKDEVVPKPWLDTLDALQMELASEVEWQAGDVLVVDNLAVQHARWPWTGDRKILASFWGQPGLKAELIE